MPILTKAAAPVKGTATLFTLDKVALIALGSVAADPYFSDSANWKSVSLFYHSSVGNQHEIVKFDATKSSPTSKFLVSEQSRDIFQIQKIVIKDFDGGEFDVLRSELTTAEFDVDMSSAVSTIVWDSVFQTSSSGNGQLERVSGGGYAIGAISNTSIVGDFTLTAIMDINVDDGIFLGYNKTIHGSLSSTPQLNYSDGESLFYSSYMQMYPINGYNVGPVQDTAPYPLSHSTQVWEFKRVGSLITAKCDGIQLFHENYSGALYMLAVIYNGTNKIQSISVI